MSDHADTIRAAKTCPEALADLAVAYDVLAARCDALGRERDEAVKDRDDFAHGAWGSSAATIVALKHRSEQAKARCDALENALRAIATGEKPDGYESWLSGRSWRIELARHVLAAGERQET